MSLEGGFLDDGFVLADGILFFFSFSLRLRDARIRAWVASVEDPWVTMAVGRSRRVLG